MSASKDGRRIDSHADRNASKAEKAARRVRHVWVEISQFGHIVGCYPSRAKGRMQKWPDNALVPFEQRPSPVKGTP